MYKVGVTGGIGSGKSIICRLFNTLGVPVYHADQRARYLMEHDQEMIRLLKKTFGNSIYTKKKLSSRLLAGRVFSDTDALHQLNDIVHPTVAQDFMQWVRKQDGSDYVLHEAAILFESDAWKMMDMIVSVHAPEELRIRRVMKRSDLSRAEVLERIKKQMDQAEMNRRADVIIYNDDEHMVLPQIMDLHGKILREKLLL
jgi:dephospho-CoA kinase